MRLSPMDLKPGNHVLLASRPEIVTSVQDMGDWVYVSVEGDDGDPFMVRPYDTVPFLTRPTGIGPRTDEFDNQKQRQWMRRIGGTLFHFLHVKVSTTHPRIVVTRETPEGWDVVHTFSA
ncbi:hypothetical protein [Streptomyces sp. NBC_01353]|uniref:hypothetical protein n=1 Tax=Streptomyces sp. NBC_01353 TaxID=2903835 RepID=UPI002E339934|nr:hypothetical protein [Streptomyces sp. NBC_01353]